MTAAPVTTLGVFDARSRFSELIDRAEKGEEIIVTRHGRVVARIAPPEDPVAPTRTAREGAAVVERFRVLREDIRATGGPITRAEIRTWIREGQR